MTERVSHRPDKSEKLYRDRMAERIAEARLDKPIMFATVHEAAWSPSPVYAGAEYRCEHLYARDLMPDTKRPLLKTTLRKMEKSWDLDRARLGHWVASRRKSAENALIEGNHRYYFLHEMGLLDTLLHVQVYRGLSRDAEYDFWRQLIPNKAATPSDELWVSYQAGNPEAVALVGPLDKADLKPHNVQGSLALKAALGAAGGALYSEAVDVSVQAFGRQHAKNHGYVIYAVALILERYGARVDRQRLVVILQRYEGGSAVRWNAVAKDHAGQAKPVDYLASQLVLAYNKDLRLEERFLPPWQLGLAGRVH